MYCGTCSAPVDDPTVCDAPCGGCGGRRLLLGRFLLTEPLADGSDAIDLEAGEPVRLWAARPEVPDGVEVVGAHWVSNTRSEAAVLALMDPLDDDLFGPEVFVQPPVRVVESPPPQMPRWRLRWRPVVMALMMAALVPIGMAATPPPPDYGARAVATEGRAALVEEVRTAPEVQACLAGHRGRVRARDVAHPALLTLEVSPETVDMPYAQARSGDPVLVGCLVTAARQLTLPKGMYRLDVPVGEAPPGVLKDR